MEPVVPAAGVLLDRVGEPAVESREIHADDDVGFALQRQAAKPVEESAKLEIMLHHAGQADDRMLGQVEGQFHPGVFHAGSASAEKPGLEPGPERLQIGRIRRFDGSQLPSQSADEFGGQHVAAGFAGNDHDLFGLHLFSRLQVEN